MMPKELLQIIKISHISESPWQGRLLNISEENAQNPDFIEVKELADSIERNGLMQPISVREVDGKYELIDGHRRILAYKLLGLGNIKAIIKEHTDQEAQLLSIVGNLHRKNLNTIEQALAFQKVLEAGIFKDRKELSEAIGKDETYVGDILNTLNMDDRIIQDMARKNTIKDARVLRLIRKVEAVDDSQTSYKQWKLYNHVVENNLSRQDVKDMVDRAKLKEAQKQPMKKEWQITPGKTMIHMKLKTGKLTPELQEKVIQLLEDKLAEVLGEL